MQENIQNKDNNSLNQSVSNSVPAKIQQAKTNSFLVILLSVLLIISVTISGFFAFQTQKLVKELQVMSDESKQTIQKTTESVANESSEVDPTVNWKEYKDKNGKFSFKYPNEWFIWNSVDGESVLLDEFLFDPNLIVEPDQVDITFSVTSGKELVNAYVANFLSTSQIVTKSGVIFKIMDMSLQPKVDGPASQYLFAQSNIANSLYRFGLTSNKYKSIFDQILSTFKFTN